MNIKKDKFFSIIAHDLKNPVNALIGFSGLLKLRFHRLEERKKIQFIDHIDTSAHAIFKLLMDLLDWARAESKSIQFKPQKLILEDIFRYQNELFQQQLKQKNIELLFEDKTTKENIYGDENMINTILRNLISNAIKFTPEFGTINISYSTDHTYTYIKVADTGIGMSENVMSKLFILGENTTTKGTNNETGTGLGLLVCKEFVDINYGKISVNSTIGKGSEFTIAIPRTKEISDSLSSEKIQQVQNHNPKQDIRLVLDNDDIRNLNQKRILLVDDNNEFRNTIHFMLSNYCELFEAEDGNEAYKIATENMPDLIISDIHMPQMDGLSLCKKLKNNFLTCHIPIIIITGIELTNSHKDDVRTLADAFLEKPIKPNMLLVLILNLLQNREIVNNIFINDYANEVHNLATSKVDDDLLNNLSLFIEENLQNESLSADLIANHISIDKRLLSKKLKAITNQTLFEFIRTIRLKKSISYLKEERFSLHEIANMCGFDNINYFIRSFRKNYNMTPSEYLLLMKKTSKY